MKNFRKVLALVLVVAMAIGFASMATAAFKDAADIQKTEAVEVLAAIEVINGFEDGSYKPAQKVTRAEMAKMIATILNKGEDVGPTYAGACTFADTAKHWAAGYVAFCAQEGIINGKNASTFAPDDEVTGTEAAKMILGALGHKADKAGLIGSAWASTTLSLARKNNLIGELNNMTANMGEALDRQNAAQLLFNGLKATMVEYTGGTAIQIGDVTLNQGATASNLVNNNGDYRTSGTDTALQLVEEYFPKLKLTAAGSADIFGRAANTWTFEGLTVGSYGTPAFKVYNTAVTLGQLYTDLGRYTQDKFTGGITYYVDGQANQAGVTKLTTVGNLVSGRSDLFVGGQGVTTEVYFDSLTMTLRVCEINSYAGLIVNSVPAVKDANGDISVPAYVTLKTFNGGNINAIAGTYMDAPLPAANSIATDAFDRNAKDTVVVYTKGWDAAANAGQGGIVIGSVAAAKSATGVNKGSAAVNGVVTTVTLDATTYNANVTALAAGGAYAGGTYGQSETVYFDANGNVIASTGVASTDYAYVLGAARINSFADDFQAQLLFTDGTVKIVDLASMHKNGVLTGANNNTMARGDIVTYTVDAEGKYMLNYQSANVAATAVTNKVPALTGGSNNADMNTKFVVGVVDQATNNTTYTAYTGIAAVPSFGPRGQAVIAYAVNPVTNTIAAAFCVDATVQGTASTNVMALYKTGNEALQTAGIGNQYYAVAAVVDGKVTTVKVVPTLWNQLNVGQFALAQGGSADSFGNYTALTALDSNAQSQYRQEWSFTTFGEYVNGNVTLDTAKYVEATTPVVTWNKAQNKLVVTTVDAVYAMTANTTGKYTTALSVAQGVQGAITGIYMTVDY